MNISEEVLAIKSQAPQWNFSGDCSLLELMKKISKNMDDRASHTIKAMKQLELDGQLTGIALDNATNSLRSLQFGKQFVEFRVQEDDETLASSVDPSIVPKESSKTVENMKVEFYENNMKMFKENYEPVTIEVPDSDDESSVTTTVVYRAINPYNKRPLPYIIGTRAWKENWHVGLLDDNNEYSGDDRSEEFSETSSSDGKDNQDQDESYESANATNLSDWASSTSLSNEKFSTVQNAAATSGAHPIFTQNNKATTIHGFASSHIQDNTLKYPKSEGLNIKGSEQRSIEHDLFAAVRQTPPTDDSPTISSSQASLALPDKKYTQTLSQPSISSITTTSNSLKHESSKSQHSSIDDDVGKYTMNKNQKIMDNTTPEISRIKQKPVNLFDDDDFNSFMSEIVDKVQSKKDNSTNQTQRRASEKIVPISNSFSTSSNNSVLHDPDSKVYLSPKQKGNSSDKSTESFKTSLNLFDDSPPPSLTDQESRDIVVPQTTANTLINGIFDRNNDIFDSIGSRPTKPNTTVASSIFSEHNDKNPSSSIPTKTTITSSLFDDDDYEDISDILVRKTKEPKEQKTKSLKEKTFLFDDDDEDSDDFNIFSKKKPHNGSKLHKDTANITKVVQKVETENNVIVEKNIEDEKLKGKSKSSSSALQQKQFVTNNTTTEADLLDDFNEQDSMLRKEIGIEDMHSKNDNQNVAVSSNKEHSREHTLHEEKRDAEIKKSVQQDNLFGDEDCDKLFSTHKMEQQNSQYENRGNNDNSINILIAQQGLTNDSTTSHETKNSSEANTEIVQWSDDSNFTEASSNITKDSKQPKNYANLFLEEPPDDSEFFKTLSSGALTASKMFDLEHDYFEPSLPTTPGNVKQTEPLTSSDYSGLRLFSEIPPEDDEEPSEGVIGDVRSTYEKDKNDKFKAAKDSDVSRVHKIFYDDFSETATASSNSIKSIVPRNEKDVVDRSPKSPEILVNKLKMPKININVQGLLPSTGTIPKVPRKYQETVTKKLSNTSYDIDEITNKQPLINSANNQAPVSNENILTSVCKTRVRGPAKRRPSSRRARHENYRQSLLAEEQQSPIEDQKPKNTAPIGKMTETLTFQADQISESLRGHERSTIQPKDSENKRVNDKIEDQAPVYAAQSAKEQLGGVTTKPTFLDSDDDGDLFFKPRIQTTQKNHSTKSTTIANKLKDQSLLQKNTILDSEDDDNLLFKPTSYSPMLKSSSSSQVLTPKIDAEIPVSPATNKVLPASSFLNNNSEDDEMHSEPSTPYQYTKQNLSTIASEPPPFEDKKTITVSQKSVTKSFLDSDDDDDDSDLFAPVKKPHNVGSKEPIFDATSFNTASVATVAKTENPSPMKNSLFESGDDTDDDFLSAIKKSTKPNKNALKAPDIGKKSLFSDVDSDSEDDLFGNAKVKAPTTRSKPEPALTQTQKEVYPSVPENPKADAADNPLADLLGS